MLIAALAVGAAYVLHSRSMSNWVREDIEDLDPLPFVLIHDGEVSAEAFENPKDAALVEHTAEGRHVVEMTRSEFRRGFLGRDRWAKVVLVTERPGEAEVQLRLKLLHHLGRGPDGQWEVREVEELALP